MFSSVLRHLLILAFGFLPISSAVSLHAQSQNHLGDERELDAQVRIPRSWGSLRDLPSPTSSYCIDYSGPKGISIVMIADFPSSPDIQSSNGGFS